MKAKLIAAAALTAAAFTLPQAASANSLAIRFDAPGVHIAAGKTQHGQWNHHRPHHRAMISAREAVGIVQRAGYRNARLVDGRGPRYTVSAQDWRGRRVLVEVSAYGGAITGKRHAYR